MLSTEVADKRGGKKRVIFSLSSSIDSVDNPKLQGEQPNVEAQRDAKLITHNPLSWLKNAAEVVDKLFNERFTTLDAREDFGELFAELYLHLAANLDPLRLWGACAVHRFGEVTDRIATKRHVFDQTQDAHAVFGWHVGPPA